MTGSESVSVAVRDLRAVLLELQRVRSAVASDGRMPRSEKVYLFARIKACDERITPYLQLSLFSPAQRA